MMENLKGQKFNFLTPVVPISKYKREWIWLCECDCGNQTNVRISKLKNGTTKSCGCFKNKNVLPVKNGNEHRGWRGYENMSKSFHGRIEQGAKRRNIEFNVSIEYLYNLFIEQNGKCSYTGVKIFLPINTKQLRGGVDNERIASLDRIDNNKGYIEGNLQWVCKKANSMKHTMEENYFFYWIKKIYEYKNLTNF